jgi:hypothetical protein
VSARCPKRLVVGVEEAALGIDVTTYFQTAMHATFLGHAEVNGVSRNYRIDVDNLGEPGAGRDTFKIQTDSGSGCVSLSTSAENEM